MRSTRASTYRNILTGVLVLSLVFPSMLFAASRSAKRAQLQHKKATLQTRISAVRHHLRLVKQQERQTSYQLHSVEHKVRMYRGMLQTASLRFERSKVELHRATVSLREAQAEFADARQDASQHLVAMYERGEQGYTTLLVSSNDYGEMLQRAQLAKFLMAQDRGVLDNLKAHKQKVQRYQNAVHEKTAEVAAWKEQVAVIHEHTNAKRVQVAKTLTSVRGEEAGLASELDALERDSAEVSSMLQRMQSSVAGRRRYHTVYAGPLGGLPVHGRITSGFGYRVHPISGTRRLHTGIDVAAPMGTPIFATGGGEIISAGWRGGYGNAVIIDHGGGKATLYGHMSAVLVCRGQVVKRGQQIGRVGSTGASTGPHCHYEMRINGVPVPPR